MMKQLLTFLSIGLLTTMATIANASCDDLYNHQLTTLQGKSVNLCEYQDKPILVVNTASKCGFTPQFDALEALYEEYKAQGLLVIGFPSNDFKQELQSDKEIGDFCKMTYSVKFPMIQKSVVTGPNANPFYKQLISRTGHAPMWNFYKYVIMPNAKEVYVFSSDVRPNDEAIVGRIKKGLN